MHHRLPTLTVAAAVLGLLAVCAQARPHQVEHREENDNGWSQDFTFSYDGYEHRTSAWKGAYSILWDDGEAFSLGAYVNAVTGAGLPFTWRHNAFGGLWSSYDLVTSSETNPLSLSVTLDVSGPSILAVRGLDFDVSTDLRYDLAEDWLCGVSVGGVFASAPDAGNRAGYAYGTAWLGYDTGWLPNESDSLSAGCYVATNEDPTLGTLLAAELRYAFDVTEHSRLTLAVGSELVSPWSHDPLYVGFSWSWSL